MRKVLLGTTALAAASMLAFTSTDVSAQSKAKNSGIKVTGYMHSKLYYAEQDQSFEQDAAELTSSNSGAESLGRRWNQLRCICPCK